jgi:hypothetical protein
MQSLANTHMLAIQSIKEINFQFIHEVYDTVDKNAIKYVSRREREPVFASSIKTTFEADLSKKVAGRASR